MGSINIFKPLSSFHEAVRDVMAMISFICIENIMLLLDLNPCTLRCKRALHPLRHGLSGMTWLASTHLRLSAFGAGGGGRAAHFRVDARCGGGRRPVSGRHEERRDGDASGRPVERLADHQHRGRSYDR